ncbi:uncharacterized protein DUF4238 [Yokenella regensburgei]|uniref:Uncharacterized protein DUF4238 n=1 Tax=Yokenella regensburgei TaxID=158877 RepID=A0ABX9S5P1_9ENTR|nr:DUF4238 domain-containing protein [Yokenella regensburgei]RKR64949.1 uncharacterized protein DUF4238 [Yokenella regensburgei]VFS14487.1 Uncharacterised protein [Yokenella regensburgei]
MKDKNLLHTDVVRQHTVPKFLLQNFIIHNEKRKKDGQVFSFNKQSRRIMKMSINDATVHKKFYNLHEHPTIVSIESLLAIYETKAGSVIKNIISTKDVNTLSKEERKYLSRFVAVQYLRSRGEYENQKHIAQELYSKLTSRGLTNDKLENYFDEGSFEKNSKGNFLSQIVNCDLETAIINEKDWILFETTVDNPFFISDNPVTMYNDTNFKDRSNTGIALVGVQIYLPLSPTLTIAMVCPSLKKPLLDERDFIYKCITNKIGGSDLNIFDRLDFLKSILDTRLVKIEDWRLNHLNNLQLWRAEQFIFSQKDDFERIKILVDDHAELSRGPRSVVI